MCGVEVIYLNEGEALWEELAAIASDEGLCLYDVKKAGGNDIRVVVDKPAKDEGSVTSDDCSRLCRRLMVYFSAEGPRWGILPEPRIEVSSPGVCRDLRLQRHFSGAVGERVKMCFRKQAEPGVEAVGSGVVVGELRDVRGSELIVVDEKTGVDVVVRREDVTRAQVEFDFHD